MLAIYRAAASFPTAARCARRPAIRDQSSAQFYISKHYLCRIFKAATGFSVMEYIIYSRVLRARQLLQEGVSVQQAAS